jgi:hypothetical protein
MKNSRVRLTLIARHVERVLDWLARYSPYPPDGEFYPPHLLEAPREVNRERPGELCGGT